MNMRPSLLFGLASVFLFHLVGGKLSGQIVEPTTWAKQDGRIERIDQYHFDDAANVSPRLDGRAAFFGQRVLAVASIAKIQKELGLNQQQQKKIQNIYVDSVGLAQDANRKLSEAMLKIATELHKKGNVSQAKFDELSKESKEKCRASYRQIDASANELLANVLDNGQIKRLRELVVQADIHQFGFAKAVELRQKELMLEEATMKKLKVESNKQDNEFKAKLKELSADKKAKILKILTPVQRKKLKELQGKPAEFKQKK